MTIRRQVLYPDDVADSDIILPGKKRREPNAEWRIQAACVKLLRRVMQTHPEIRFIATMPEGQRSPARAAIGKMMGLQPGVADLIILHKRGFYMGVAWIEFKRPGGKLSAPQQEWAAWFGDMYACEVHRCDSVGQFKDILAAILP